MFLYACVCATADDQIRKCGSNLLMSSLLREMCVRFADLERKLGEIDRARAVYMHASQMADPRVSANSVNPFTCYTQN